MDPEQSTAWKKEKRPWGNKWKNLICENHLIERWIVFVRCPGHNKLSIRNLLEIISFIQDFLKYESIINPVQSVHTILDYLQALTPKQTHNARKTLHFLQEYFYTSLIQFFKMIQSSNFSD